METRFLKYAVFLFNNCKHFKKQKGENMEVDTSYISDNNTYPVNHPEYIVIHNTDNFHAGADAKAHASAQYHGNFKGMSAHYYVDDKENIYQAAPIKRGCWHVGVNYGGMLFGTVNNRNSIGVEMCVQEGYDFEKALENTVELVRFLMKKWKIPSAKVIQHYDVCKKNCPSQIREHGAWERFKTEIEIPSGESENRDLYRVKTDVLNIRSGPGTEYEIVGKITDRGSYTITETANATWGKLASGAGWISLNYVQKV